MPITYLSMTALGIDLILIHLKAHCFEIGIYMSVFSHAFAVKFQILSYCVQLKGKGSYLPSPVPEMHTVSQ